MKSVASSKDALKTLRQMPTNTSLLIRAKIDPYAADPDSLANNVKALQGERGSYRLRVGNWRVVFAEEGQVVSIVRIAPRGGAYD